MRRTTFATTRVFIWAVLALFLTFPGVMGCGGGASNGSGGGSGSGESETTKVPPDPGEGDPLGAKNSKGKGWRWKGKRDHCYYVFDNNCFEDRKAACEAAGCKSGCVDDDGAPAKVSCEK